MMFANAKYIQSGSIGGLHLLQEIAHSLSGAEAVIRSRVRCVDDEAVDAEFHFCRCRGAVRALLGSQFLDLGECLAEAALTRFVGTCKPAGIHHRDVADADETQDLLEIRHLRVELRHRFSRTEARTAARGDDPHFLAFDESHIGGILEGTPTRTT
jgi:hypothetical protein